MALALLLVACSGPSGGAPGEGRTAADARSFEPPPEREPAARQRRSATRIRERAEPPSAAGPSAAPGAAANAASTTSSGAGGGSYSVIGSDALGRDLGTFRNTYYNFPSERDYRGPTVSLFDARCRALANVPRAFHDTLCVQGSGSLASGVTVSFARRHCSCARTCPRTGQQICFDRLDAARFPFGRGSAGSAIVPLRSVAVDVSVIPLGTRLFIPDYVGLPEDASGTGEHDGCFLAEDRGIHVIGEHVDVFTGGGAALMRLWMARVPTNRGVHVYADSPRCAHLAQR